MTASNRMMKQRQHRRQINDSQQTARGIRDYVEERQLGGGTTRPSASNDDDEESTSTSPTSTDDDDESTEAESSTSRLPATSSTPRTTSSSSSRIIPSTTSISSSSSSSRVVPSTTSSSASSTSSTSSSSSSSLEPTSTSSSSTSSSLSSSTRTSASVVAVTNSSSTRTSIQVITTSASLAATAAASTSAASDSSAPSAGLIIGIVAGALAGVVVLAAAVGFLVKKASKQKQDPYETDPFDKDEFRRQSAMIPEGFDEDDDNGPYPPMMEHHHYTGGYEDGALAGSQAANGYEAAGAVAMTSSWSHNGSGAPRPPTMFARHADFHASDQAAPTPAFGGPAPQMPSMAYGGEDPYAAAGVAGFHNIANPYAHLDRTNSSNRRYQEPQQPQYDYHNGPAGQQQSDSYEQQQQQGGPFAFSQQGHDQQSHRQPYLPRSGSSNLHQTTGRPGTADSQGRSGTPDLPNVQQTYALGSSASDSEHFTNIDDGRQSALGRLDQAFSGGASSALSNPYDRATNEDQRNRSGSAGSFSIGNGGARPPSALQIRNLTGGRHSPPHHQQQNTMADQSFEDDAAYGGVY